jgi:hypothetical protein
MNKLLKILLGAILLVVTAILGFFAGALYTGIVASAIVRMLGNIGLLFALVPYIVVGAIVYKDDKNRKDNFPHVCLYGFIAGFMIGSVMMFVLMSGVGTP